MKIFLDANILVSVLNKEYPLFTYSSRILSLADDKRFQVFTSPVCLAIAFYFAEKKCGSALAKKKIELLIDKMSIAVADKEVVSNAIQDKRVEDFEDGIEYYSAIKANCTCLITEDIEDFHFAKAEVLNSKSFLEKYVLPKLRK
jgi:predicted nucleic acid-binding protein